MATNVKRYTKRYEDLIASGKSHADAHEQASRESESTTTKTPEKKSRMSIKTYLTGAKSPVPKAKADILREADKDIRALQGSKTERTKAIEAADPGIESDVQKAIRERARKARKLLTGKK